MLKKNNRTGRLKIGDDWNAISIIALSQNNPLKAIAEFVENSIDAQARNVTIVRGRERGHHYLKIVDDGSGLPRAADGTPDFKYVATHICDSIKRRLKAEGEQGLQGEFGIGLLSFWTVGHRLSMLCSGSDGLTYEMVMEKGKPGYTINRRARLVASAGTQLTISPLLAGVRALNGEKIQRYLAAELRDRIRASGVNITIIDRQARVELCVEPRQFSGQLLHQLPAVSTPFGDCWVELYLNERSPDHAVSLFRNGTRVLPSVGAWEEFAVEPWTSGYFQGIIDAPFLHVTPGTRDGIIRDERFAAFVDAVGPLGERLTEIAAAQRRAEDERASRNILRSVQHALREAILALPREEYDWFDVRDAGKGASGEKSAPALSAAPVAGDSTCAPVQKQFFEFSGPLHACRISPASSLVPVGGTKALRLVGLDRNRRRIDAPLRGDWAIITGTGTLDADSAEVVTYTAPDEPGLTRVRVTVRQGELSVEAESVLTIVDSLLPAALDQSSQFKKGLPGYTLESAAAQPWRSRFDEQRNLIIINSGHRDFVFATRQKSRKLRYICRLFAKELIVRNFSALPAEQLLERLVELSLYSEENLK